MSVIAFAIAGEKKRQLRLDPRQERVVGDRAVLDHFGEPGDELAPGQRSAVDELLVSLANAFPGERGDLERVVRETMESLAYAMAKLRPTLFAYQFVITARRSGF